MSDSSEVRFKWFGLSSDLRFKRFGCQSMCFKRFWLCVDLSFKWGGCQLIWDSSDLFVNQVEIQMISLSIGLRFKWVGCQLIWNSSDLVVNRCVIRLILFVSWFEIQVSWLSIDLRFRWFGFQSLWDSHEFVVSRFEIQMSWLSTDLRFKRFGCQMIWGSSTVIWLSTDVWFKWFCQMKLFCETSFKNEALKIKNEAFPRDFLQNWSFEAQKRSVSAILLSKWSFEDQKRSFSARLPSKTKLWSSKTKLFCETSFKNESLKIKNEAFLRDFLQKWQVDQTLDLTEFQYVLKILKCMLQKYCACHAKVEPRHTKSSNTSVTWNLQPFHGFSVGAFKHRHHKARNPCACHAKRIVSDPLQIHQACQRFCNPHELLRLPRILQRVEIPAPATWNTLSTSKNVPSTWCFNGFDFQIVLARRRGAKLNFQKCSEHATFWRFWLPNRSRAKLNFQKCSEHASFYPESPELVILHFGWNYVICRN